MVRQWNLGPLTNQLVRMYSNLLTYQPVGMKTPLLLGAMFVAMLLPAATGVVDNRGGCGRR